uniref:Retrotransposon Copia-like N-terminal domain-containing protein n=1 Tax=Cucumis melo TaxID=3656 RepID=A0A9I9EGF9_CUCME
MYSKKAVTLVPTLSSSYATHKVARSTGYFSREKLNGNNYFSWSLLAKMVLEGRHKFGFLIGKYLVLHRAILEGRELSSSIHIDQQYGTPDWQTITVCCNNQDTILQASECFSAFTLRK